MRPTEVLSDEHRVIRLALDCLERLTERARVGKPVQAQDARDAVSFFRVFADRYHHAKEDNLLLPVMERRGFASHAGPSAAMRREHERARALLGRIESCLGDATHGNRGALEEFVESARDYVALLRDNIEKEDLCVFPMVDRSLDESAQSTLLSDFERVGEGEVGPAEDRQLRVLAADLARRLGLSPLRPFDRSARSARSGHGAPARRSKHSRGEVG